MGSSFLFPERICEFFHSLTLFLAANEGCDSDLEMFLPRDFFFFSEDPVQTESKPGMNSLKSGEEGSQHTTHHFASTCLVLPRLCRAHLLGSFHHSAPQLVQVANTDAAHSAEPNSFMH